MTTTFAPLAGITVLDFSHVIAGPLATFYLARLGARVIKIEGVGGDVMRSMGRGPQTFTALNDGKEILRLDLRGAADRAEAEKLGASADIVVNSLRPGALDKLGFGIAAMLARNPRIVYCTISGYGAGGPWADRPAYDHVIQAVTGMAMMGGLEGEPPVKVGFPVVDTGTAMLAGFAILAALRERDRTGRAVALDVPMTGAAMQLMYTMACEALTHGETPKRIGNRGFSGSPTADTYEAEGGWIAIAANKPSHVIGLLSELGLDALRADRAIFPHGLSADGPAKFATAADPAKLRAALATAIRREDVRALEDRLNARNIPAARLRRLGEFATEMKRDAPESMATLGQGPSQVLSPGLGFGARFPGDED